MKQISRKYCKNCDMETKHETQTPNHVLHFLLSVITLGTWLIVWIILAMATQPPKCDECGHSYSGVVDMVAYTILIIGAVSVLWVLLNI